MLELLYQIFILTRPIIPLLKLVVRTFTLIRALAMTQAMSL